MLPPIWEAAGISIYEYRALSWEDKKYLLKFFDYWKEPDVPLAEDEGGYCQLLERWNEYEARYQPRWNYNLGRYVERGERCFYG